MTPYRIALLVLLLGSAALFTWNLGASGDANSFYAAAVQAGTRSWKAFFFGSLDSSSFITVDKPPASLWVMELSGRIFGFSSWSLLVPQALEGVAAVGLVCGAVRRIGGDWAGITAGALLALTPVAALMFRFDNPDALLVALLSAGAYCLTRALERGAWRWILGAGLLVGFAFLAKMLQAFIVLPGFAAVYLLAAPVGLRRRVAQTLAAGAATIVGCGWWLLAVALWPVGSRPMIDGSPDNNVFDLIFGYNGLGRVFGGSGNGGAGGGAGANFSGAAGPLRLFDSLMGGQASWLIPVALLALGLGVLARGRRPRTDRLRAGLLLWGGWLVVTGIVFSFSSGIIHTYYTVALAPAIAALVALGLAQAWAARDSRVAQAAVGAGVLGTAAWSFVLLDRTPTWQTWLEPLMIAGAVLGTGLLALAAFPGAAGLGARGRRRVLVAGAVLGAVACLAGPAAYAVQTVATAHTGSTPTAGPSTGRGGFGGGFGGRGSGGGAGGPGRGGAPSGGGQARSRGGLGDIAPSARNISHTGGSGGGPGETTVSGALRRALRTDADRYRWVAATSGSQSAASIELATGGLPVMAIGGFSGEGGNLSLTAFRADVARGEIHYWIAGGGMGGRGGTSTQILAWVKAHYAAQRVGATTVYDLTQPR